MGREPEHNPKKIDVIFLVLIAFCIGLIWIGSKIFYTTPGSIVVIQVGNENMASLSLVKNQTYEITIDGTVQNVLCIQDGAAFMKDATCPDHLCVKQGEITKDGQAIVCLPHRVVVRVIGSEETSVDTTVQ